jgi:DNA-binding NtrC family response regulator
MRQTSEYDHPAQSSPALPAWLVGRSAPLCALARAADDLGHAEVNLLIQGEPGTGKCALAETIRARSLRAARPFAVVRLTERTEAEVRNDLFGSTGAGAIVTAPPGATLYLDGVEGLTADLQRRLLLALSSAGVWSQVRVISGANVALEEAVRLGRFRRDLFFRLGVLRISIPPLRERREDIPQIVEALVAARGSVTGREPSALDRSIVNELCADVWPGNARELDHTIDRLFEAARGGAPRIEHLRAVLGRRSREQPMPDVFPLRELERDYIQAVLISCNWNQSLAARRLGIGRNTLLRKIKTFGFGKAEAA